VSLTGEGTFRHRVKKGYTVFRLRDHGRARSEATAGPGRGAWSLFEREGPSVESNTDGETVRLLLVSGKPLKNRVAWYGRS